MAANIYIAVGPSTNIASLTDALLRMIRQTDEHLSRKCSSSCEVREMNYGNSSAHTKVCPSCGNVGSRRQPIRTVYMLFDEAPYRLDMSR